MTDPRAKSLRLLTVSEASSRKVASAEMHKITDFIHSWLYGLEPAPSYAPEKARAARDSELLPRKTFLN